MRLESELLALRSQVSIKTNDIGNNINSNGNCINDNCTDILNDTCGKISSLISSENTILPVCSKDIMYDITDDSNIHNDKSKEIIKLGFNKRYMIQCMPVDGSVCCVDYNKLDDAKTTYAGLFNLYKFRLCKCSACVINYKSLYDGLKPSRMILRNECVKIPVRLKKFYNIRLLASFHRCGCDNCFSQYSLLFKPIFNVNKCKLLGQYDVNPDVSDWFMVLQKRFCGCHECLKSFLVFFRVNFRQKLFMDHLQRLDRNVFDGLAVDSAYMSDKCLNFILPKVCEPVSELVPLVGLAACGCVSCLTFLLEKRNLLRKFKLKKAKATKITAPSDSKVDVEDINKVNLPMTAEKKCDSQNLGNICNKKMNVPSLISQLDDADDVTLSDSELCSISEEEDIEEDICEPNFLNQMDTQELFPGVVNDSVHNEDNANLLSITPTITEEINSSQNIGKINIDNDNASVVTDEYTRIPDNLDATIDEVVNNMINNVMVLDNNYDLNLNLNNNVNNVIDSHIPSDIVEDEVNINTDLDPFSDEIIDNTASNTNKCVNTPNDNNNYLPIDIDLDNSISYSPLPDETRIHSLDSNNIFTDNFSMSQSTPLRTPSVFGPIKGEVAYSPSYCSTISCSMIAECNSNNFDLSNLPDFENTLPIPENPFAGSLSVDAHFFAISQTHIQCTRCSEQFKVMTIERNKEMKNHLLSKHRLNVIANQYLIQCHCGKLMNRLEFAKHHKTHKFLDAPANTINLLEVTTDDLTQT